MQGVRRMWYKMQYVLHLCVKALDAVCCCICVAVLLLGATCVVWRLGQLIHN